jgi:hypothetical protein
MSDLQAIDLSLFDDAPPFAVTSEPLASGLALTV